MGRFRLSPHRFTTGTGDVAIDMAAMIPQAQEIIVTTPHLAASHVASRAGLMAQHTKHTILGVVENMAYFEGADGQKLSIWTRWSRTVSKFIADTCDSSDSFRST